MNQFQMLWQFRGSGDDYGQNSDGGGNSLFRPTWIGESRNGANQCFIQAATNKDGLTTFELYGGNPVFRGKMRGRFATLEEAKAAAQHRADTVRV
jgi:hypothetical protein